MRSVGDAYDNARCQVLFRALGCELLDRYRFHEARLAVFDSSNTGTGRVDIRAQLPLAVIFRVVVSDRADSM